MTWLVGLIAAVEAFAIGAFAIAAMSGDEWGIARAVALLLTVPFVCLTLPALLLVSRGYGRSAALLAVLSVAAMGLAWRFA
jgi:hypothetical protein